MNAATHSKRYRSSCPRHSRAAQDEFLGDLPAVLADIDLNRIIRTGDLVDHADLINARSAAATLKAVRSEVYGSADWLYMTGFFSESEANPVITDAVVDGASIVLCVPVIVDAVGRILVVDWGDVNGFRHYCFR